MATPLQTNSPPPTSWWCWHPMHRSRRMHQLWFSSKVVVEEAIRWHRARNYSTGAARSAWVTSKKASRSLTQPASTRSTTSASKGGLTKRYRPRSPVSREPRNPIPINCLSQTDPSVQTAPRHFWGSENIFWIGSKRDMFEIGDSAASFELLGC